MELAIVINGEPVVLAERPPEEAPQFEQSTTSTAVRVIAGAALLAGGTAAIVGGFSYRPDILWTVGELCYVSSMELLTSQEPFFRSTREKTLQVMGAVAISGLLGMAGGLFYTGGRALRYVGGSIALFVAPSTGSALLFNIRNPLC